MDSNKLREQPAKYVVVEGHDGTGKSTQVERLAEYLLSTHGIESYIAHEPAGTPIADAIRTVIKDGTLARDAETNLLLFTAARHEIWRRAEAELAKERWVLSARNYLSTLAYQGYAEGLSIEQIERVTREFTGKRYMDPDHTIILRLGSHALRADRISGRGELEVPDTFESRDGSFQDRVSRGYDEIAKWAGYPVIDAGRTIDEIQSQIRTIVGV